MMSQVEASNSMMWIYRDITIKNLRSHIGIVRQDPFIFSTTLRENIAYGVENASIEQVREAAEQAKIHEFIEASTREIRYQGRGKRGNPQRRTETESGYR